MIGMNKDRICSFCNQPMAGENPMFTGPDVDIRICADCASFAEELLQDEPAAETDDVCSFCGRTQEHDMKLLFGPEVKICNECIAFANKQLYGKNS